MSIFDFLKQPEPAVHKGLRAEFEKLVTALHQADEDKQLSAGHGINMANGMLLKQFGSVDAFCRLPRLDRIKHTLELTVFEEKMISQDPYVAMGLGLFKMWIEALSEHDQELITYFTKELAYFSHKDTVSGERQ